MRRASLWLALALVLSSATAAFADGKRDLDDGIAFYENLDSERAIERLRAASEAKDLSAKDRAKALLYLGMVYFENGDRSPANEAWKRAFALDRAVVVPDGTSPKTIEAIEAARAAESVSGKDPGEPGGVKRQTDGSVIATSPAQPDAKPLPTATEQPQNNELTATANPPPVEEESSLSTWLLVGGIGVALAGAAVLTIVLISGGGDCKEGGGCLTVTFE